MIDMPRPKSFADLVVPADAHIGPVVSMPGKADGAQKEGLVAGAQYIRSCFGRKIDLRDPWSTTIDIREIAHALSRICRFGAHLYPGQFYSVAAHSVMVSRLVPPHLAAAGLLHDASEAYLGSDIPKPLKDMIPEYRRIEGPWHKRIQEFYGIKLTPGAIVAIKAADDIAYATEKRDLMAPAAYEIGVSDRDEIQAAPGYRCNGSKSHKLQRLDFLERAVELGIPGV